MHANTKRGYSTEVESKIEAEIKRLSRSANIPTSEIKQKRFRRAHANLKSENVIQESNESK